MKKLILSLSFLVVVGCSSGSGSNPVAGTDPETNPEMTKTTPETNSEPNPDKITPNGDSFIIECIVNDPITKEYVTTAVYESPVRNNYFCADLRSSIRDEVNRNGECPNIETLCQERIEVIENAIESYINLMHWLESESVEDTDSLANWLETHVEEVY